MVICVHAPVCVPQPHATSYHILRTVYARTFSGGFALIRCDLPIAVRGRPA
jgi:hypothetical protein